MSVRLTDLCQCRSKVARELSRSAPFDFLKLCIPPVQNGSVSVISLHMVVDRLRDLLPPTFEELEKVRTVRKHVGLARLIS
jgi:hypothetical protein